MSYLDRAGPRAVQVMAASSAATSSRELIGRLPAYAARLGDRALAWLGPVLVNAAGRDPASRQELLAAALSIAVDDTWRGFVTDLSIGANAPADVAVLIAALHSARPAIREATIWRVVEQMSGGVSMAPALAAAAVPDPASPDVTWERFGREPRSGSPGVSATSRSREACIRRSMWQHCGQSSSGGLHRRL